MNLLFVCTAAQQRSPTAAALFADEHATKCVGTHSFSRPITQHAIDWADTVFVMTKAHADYLDAHFDAQDVIVLDIPDVYPRGDEELKRMLRERVDQHV